MVQARDELFVKLALRHGLFSQQEAVQFLHQYREEGAPGEGIGHWLVEHGIVTEEVAQQIRDAIAHRAEGHVADTRRRVPKAKKAARTSGRVAAAHAEHGHHGAHAPHRHHHGHHGHHIPPRKVVNPTQQIIFIGSGVVAIGLLIFLIFEFQKESPSLQDLNQESTEKSTTEKPESAEEVANRLTGGDATPADLPNTPQWTPQEIESMRSRINDAITLARNHMGDGRPGRGVEAIRKRAAELGDTLPPEIQNLVDSEISELQTIVDETYAEILAELKEAKAAGDDEGVENALFTIEDTCGPAYLEKAKQAVQ